MPAARTPAAVVAVALVVTTASPGPARAAGSDKDPRADFREQVLEDFEQGGLGYVNTDVRRATVKLPSDKAARGKGCLELNLSPDDPLRLTFDITPDQLTEYDWLEYDLTGAKPGAVLVETFAGADDEAAPPLAGAVVSAPRWTGQVLLAELGQRGPDGAAVQADLRFTALAKPAAVHLDAVRLVRDRPPPVPPEVGGAYAFGRGRITWPGFEAVNAQTVRTSQEMWIWDSLVPPQISRLGWPDPLQGEVLGAGVISRRDSAYTLTLQLRPGDYEGVVLAAPISSDGLVRPVFGLRCNGAVLTGRDWPIERMFTEEAIFFGRGQRDFSAELVRQRWVDPAFLELPYRVRAPNGSIVLESNGVSLGGLVVYPAQLARAFEDYLQRQRKRRQAYFAQQSYACVHAMPAGPPGQPNEAETKAGAMLMTAGLMQLLDEGLLTRAARVIRQRLKRTAIPGQVLVLPLGVAAIEDIEGVTVDVEKGRSGSVKISEVREFPIHWRGPVRRAVPLWLDRAEPQDITAGRVVWYLIELGIPRSARGRTAKYRLLVEARNRAALRLDLEVALAPVRAEQTAASLNVLYPEDWESGYLFHLFGAPRDTDVGTLILDDYRVLRDYGLGATIVRGITLGGAVDEPRVHTARAAIRARFASRAGLNGDAPGMIDFTSVATHRHWSGGPSPAMIGAAAEAFRRLRGDVHRAGADITAVIASRLTPREGLSQLEAPSTVLLANILKDTGWANLGVVFDPVRWSHSAGGDDPALKDLMGILGQLDHVVAPLAPARAVRQKHKALRVELLEPLAGRFDAGFLPWIEGLDGVWVGRVHRRTAPFHPIASAYGDDLPLLIPSRGQPAPTLRLLALREGTTDGAYAHALMQTLAKRRRAEAEKIDAAKRTLESVRTTLIQAWQEAVQEDLDAGRRPARRRPAAPPTDVLDRARESLLNSMIDLSRRR